VKAAAEKAEAEARAAAAAKAAAEKAEAEARAAAVEKAAAEKAKAKARAAAAAKAAAEKAEAEARAAAGEKAAAEKAEAEARAAAAAKAAAEKAEAEARAAAAAKVVAVAPTGRGALRTHEATRSVDEEQSDDDVSMFEEATPATEDPNASDDIEHSEDAPRNRSALISGSAAARNQDKVQRSRATQQDTHDKIENDELAEPEDDDDKLSTVPWFWKGDKGGRVQNCWVPYDVGMNQKLEIAHQKALEAVEAAAGEDQPAPVSAWLNQQCLRLRARLHPVQTCA
jgi:hypothetical protein